ncbi:MAG TPA: SDR family oxidoreductase [Solirubrobacteraceae bacterium]|jgi:NAD(P)-dependent dehydrogenase (short-subunit alcohol dehydrogenase family)|nr:SDR family oxidoreductase [Solirubrobacteraceae bacterium]
MELENKTALITGAGATGGIGAATARLFAREGATVVISGRDADRGARVVAEIDAAGHTARFVLADLTDLVAVRRLADDAGDVDILVNNAAAFAVGPTVDQDSASFDESFDANVRGPYFLTAALAPRMFAKGAGSIVNVSTMAARIGLPGMSVYGATKSALESLTRTWAAEFAPAGVRVNAVAPGPTRSDKVVGLMGDAAEQLGRTTPLARMASTSEIAQVILFLASDRSSYVTGATLRADGGRTAI